jgi:hypothetical protein
MMNQRDARPSTPGCRRMTGGKTPRPSCGSCAPCSRPPAGGGPTSCWSGATTASPARCTSSSTPSEFEGLGIDFVSYSEGADTTAPQGKLLFGIMASLAEFERPLIAERVKVGMQRAKAQGKHTGRPALPLPKRKSIEACLRRYRRLRVDDETTLAAARSTTLLAALFLTGMRVERALRA